MARKRDLRPAFFMNEYLAELPFEARLLFAGLWTIADRRGRLEDRPVRIKGALFPYDNLDVNQLLQMLADSEDKFIIRYVVDEKRYIQITNFEKNQHIHKEEVESIIPAPHEHHIKVVEAPPLGDASTTEAPEEHHSNTPSSLIASSLIACSRSLNSARDGDGLPEEFHDETLAELSNTLTGFLGRPPSPMEVDSAEFLLQQHGREWFDTALLQSSEKGARNIAYLRAKLERWASNGGPDNIRGSPQQGDYPYSPL